MTDEKQARKKFGGTFSMICGGLIMLMGIGMIAMDPTGGGAVFTAIGAVFVALGAGERATAKKTDKKDS